MENYRTIILVFTVLLVVGSIFYLESGKPELPSGSVVADVEVKVDTILKEEKSEKYETAKEISTPDAFINTDGITIKENIGKKIILVDFWTYSCINCQRTLPYLNDWHKKYADDGLLILGIHTPEFEFEKEYNNVKRAVEKFGIEYPVILDNDFSTWRSYKNRYWPRKYLIDIDGFIVYDHIGEGAYEETEKKIVDLLNEKNQKMGESKVSLEDGKVPEGAQNVDFNKVKTSETYLGASRMKNIGNLPSKDCLSSECDFNLSSEIKENTFELGGKWQIKNENSILKSDKGSIVIKFIASKVNLVAGADKEIKAEIYLDGQKVNEGAGSAVKDGVIVFKAHDLYNLIDLKENYEEHTLEIRFQDGGVSVFAFTFG